MSALNPSIELLRIYMEINAEQKCKIYIFETFMNFSNQAYYYSRQISSNKGDF